MDSGTAEEGSHGYISILVANLGYRKTEAGKAAIEDTFHRTSAGIFTVQEANEHAPPKQWLQDKAIHYKHALGDGEQTVGIGIRASVGHFLHHEDNTMIGGKFKGAECYNCFFVARLALNKPFQGRSTLCVGSVHLHRQVAKRAAGGACKTAANAFWENVAYTATTYDPLILTGDFNMAADRVSEEVAEASKRLGYEGENEVVATPIVRPIVNSQGEAECLAVYWVTQAQHPRPWAVAPHLSEWDQGRHLWKHGAHWPLLAILKAPGSKRKRTDEGQARQKDRLKKNRKLKKQARREAEQQPEPSSSASWWTRATGEWWSGPSWGQSRWSSADWSRGYTDAPANEEEEEWHSARGADTEGSADEAPTYSTVDLRPRSDAPGSSTDPIVVPRPPPGPPPTRAPPHPDGESDNPYYEAVPVLTVLRPGTSAYKRPLASLCGPK